MSTEGFDGEDGGLNAASEIQPMINEETTEIQTLESASQGVFNLIILTMAGDYLLNYFVSTSLSYFWTLVNS